MTGTLTYRLAFRVVDQELRAHKFEFRVPDELRRKPALNDGDAIARKLVDALLLGTIETSLLDPLTVVRLTDDFTKRLTEVRAALGPVTSVGTPARNDECKRTHCVSIEVTGAKQRALFKVELDHVVVRWRVWKVEFSLIE